MYILLLFVFILLRNIGYSFLALRGAATLRARTASGVGSANETVHLLQYNRRSGIDSEAMSQDTIVFDFLKGRSLLARETLLVVIKKNGNKFFLFS